MTGSGSSNAVVCHLTLKFCYLLGHLGVKGLREGGEQAGQQLFLPRLLVLDLQGATESTGESTQVNSTLMPTIITVAQCNNSPPLPPAGWRCT